MTDRSKQHCENKMQGNQITLSRNEYERLAAYRKRVIPYMCPDEAKDWQAFFDLIETRPHTPAAPAPETRREYLTKQNIESIRKAEREQFAEQIRKKVKEINDSGTCPYGWEPEGRECNDDCTRCVVDAAIESLRGGGA